MKNYSQTRVWNFDLPPFPREGLFHLDMSEHCQVNRFLKWQPSCLACMNQLDVLSIPGFLRWGDLTLARALSRAETGYVSPRSSDGTKLPASEFTALQKEFLLLKDRIGRPRKQS